MSVKLMTKVYEAHFHDIHFEKEQKKKSGETITRKITIVASTLKSIALALADNANDEGEGAYPGLTTLEDKTELSRHTVILTLIALKHDQIIAYAGISKYGTNNYTINKEKVIEMATWERQERKKKVVKPVHPSESSSPDLVNPLPETSESTSPEPSFNRDLNQLGANAPVVPKREKQDKMDTFLGFERLKQERAAQLGLSPEVLDAVESYPSDCQQGARLMFQKHNLIPPAKPHRSQKGGDYADWINGIRDIAKLCAGYKVSLEDGFNEFYKIWNPSPFTFDRPGAMTKTMRAALARLNLREGVNEPTTEKEPEHHPVPRPAHIPKPTTFRPRVA